MNRRLVLRRTPTRRLRDAYWQGAEAFIDGKSLNDNPYRSPPDAEMFHSEWYFWRKGWFGADL